MKILLTPDQESTLWHFMETILCPSGETVYSFPFYLKPMGKGEYERLTFDQLSEDVKDVIMANKGIKIPDNKEETMHEWIMNQENAIMATEYLYRFKYNGVDCAGLVTRSPFGNTLQIRPKTSRGDIGLGAGMMETKYFKR